MLVYYNARRAAFACFAMIFVASVTFAEDLSLQQALGIATKYNPTIAAGQLSAQSALQSAKGARALANPEVIVAPSVMGEAGSDSAILFSQPLELNGSRKARGDIAAFEAVAARFDADALRKDIALRVGNAYWDVAKAQELVSLNQDNVDYLETVRAAVQKQYDVGAAPGSQPMKMEVELARARQELVQAKLKLAQDKTSLNALLNRPCEVEFVTSDPLIFKNVCADRQSLVALAISKRPEIAAAESQFNAAKSRISAARALRIPDLAIQARKESFDAGSDGGLALAITLPLIDWGSAKSGKQSALTAARSREKQLETVRVGVITDVQQAINQVETTSQIVREYQSGILEKSEQLAQMAKKGYEKGASSYLELLEAQRTLRSTRSSYYTALAEHAKALVQLEWAIGCSINTEVIK
ncbi:MAG: TolC family protein [Armatimonadota bacterium]|nr:TolC family protein [bacterium]